MRQRFIDECNAELKACEAYRRAIEVIRDDVLPKWDGKPCGKGFEADCKDAVGDLCNVRVARKYTWSKEVVLSVPNSEEYEFGVDFSRRDRHYHRPSDPVGLGYPHRKAAKVD